MFQPWPDEAGRGAYLAAFHPAQADYETGEAAAVGRDEATAAIQTASAFVSFIDKMLSDG